jgi:hypothetical protein
LNSTDFLLTSFTTYPNTSYINGYPLVLGQIATESFTIAIPIINANTSPIGKIIDDLVLINSITINSLTFALSNQTSAIF